MTFAEIVLVVAFLTIVLTTQLALSRSWTLFTRKFWLDEIVTYTTVTDPKLRHSIAAITGGLDTNPPGYHLLLRGFLRLAGRTDETSIRFFGCLSMLAALAGFYANARLVYSPLVALTVVMAMCQHRLILRYAFEARMYGLWLAGVVWFSYGVTRVWTTPNDLWSKILLVCTSVLTCAVHTLGPLVVVIVLVAYLVVNHSLPLSWPALGLACLGPVAFLAWMPLLGKQDALHPFTWLRRPTRWDVAACARSLALPDHVTAVLLLAVGLAPLARNIEVGDSARASGAGLILLAGLASLVLLPPALLWLSYKVQPVLTERYALPAVAAFVPGMAFVTSFLPTLWMYGLCVCLFLGGAYEMALLANSLRNQDERWTDLIRALRQTDEHVLLFESIHEFSVVLHYASDLRERCFMLDFEPNQFGDFGNAIPLCDRTHARLFRKFYPQFASMPWETVRNTPRFYLVAAGDSYQQHGQTYQPQYPGFVADSLSAGIYDLRAEPQKDERNQAFSHT
jgi:uncharacterized membrane protein